MTPPHESLQPDEIPTHAQVLRFRDGREGVVAGVNQSAAVVYVGPQAFTIPRGDWPEAFRDAVVVPPPETTRAKSTFDPDVVLETEAAQAVADTRAAEKARCSPAVVVSPSETVSVTHDLIPDQVPSLQPSTLQVVAAVFPDAPAPTTGNRPSRRDRQRKP